MTYSNNSYNLPKGNRLRTTKNAVEQMAWDNPPHNYHLSRNYVGNNSFSISEMQKLRYGQKFILPEAQLARNYGTEITQIPCKNYGAPKSFQDNSVKVHNVL